MSTRDISCKMENGLHQGLHVSCLPLEIMAIIFGFLDKRGKGRVARVCVAWRNAVYKQSVWRDVTVKLNPKKLDVTFLPTLAARGVRGVKLVNAYASVLPKTLEEVCHGFPRLERLDLTNCFAFNHKTITDSNLQEFSHLTELCLCNCNKLTDDVVKVVTQTLGTLVTLNLQLCKLLTNDSLVAISGNLKYLKKLYILRCERITDHGIAFLAGMDVEKGTSCPMPQLDELEVRCCWLLTDMFLFYLSVGQPNLKSLVVSGNYGITDKGMEYLSGMSILEKIGLCSCDRITDKGLEHLSNLPLKRLDLQWRGPGITEIGFKHLSKVTTFCKMNAGYGPISDIDIGQLANGQCRFYNLNLTESPSLTDDGLRHLSTMPSLQFLDISRCKSVTGEGLTYLAEGEAKLEHLCFHGCRKINSDGLLRISRGQLTLRQLFLSSFHADNEGLTLAASNLQDLHILKIDNMNRISEINKIRRLADQIVIPKPPCKPKKKGGVLPRFIFSR